VLVDEQRTLAERTDWLAVNAPVFLRQTKKREVLDENKKVVWSFDIFRFCKQSIICSGNALS
jgi:hypothetical protein